MTIESAVKIKEEVVIVDILMCEIPFVSGLIKLHRVMLFRVGTAGRA